MESKNNQRSSRFGYKSRSFRSEREVSNELVRNTGGFVAIEVALGVAFTLSVAIVSLKARKQIEAKKIEMIREFKIQWRDLDGIRE